MRISDWSSDVCSADLVRGSRAPRRRRGADRPRRRGRRLWLERRQKRRRRKLRPRRPPRKGDEPCAAGLDIGRDGDEIICRRREDRKGVVQGKRVSVRVGLGGRRLHKKKKKEKR